MAKNSKQCTFTKPCLGQTLYSKKNITLKPFFINQTLPPHTSIRLWCPSTNHPHLPPCTPKPSSMWQKGRSPVHLRYIVNVILIKSQCILSDQILKVVLTLDLMIILTQCCYASGGQNPRYITLLVSRYYVKLVLNRYFIFFLVKVARIFSHPAPSKTIYCTYFYNAYVIRTGVKCSPHVGGVAS